MLTRSLLESLYRQYFIEIRKYDPFPMTLDYESVLDFAEWLSHQNTLSRDS